MKANILVDPAGRACLADFGQLTIASDTSQNSFLQGGTCRWMGPELFDPEKFGVKDGRPTMDSDRYALGMVIYEVLSGQIPFRRDHDYAVVAKVLKGERPARPKGWKGSWFVDDIWDILGRCWESIPRHRPGAEDVLRCLKKVSNSWAPPPAETTAGLPTTESPLDSTSEQSAEESQATSSSRVASPLSPQTHLPKGEVYPKVPTRTISLTPL